jgi:hypothetical protein
MIQCIYRKRGNGNSWHLWGEATITTNEFRHVACEPESYLGTHELWEVRIVDTKKTPHKAMLWDKEIKTYLQPQE